ncbi:MAG: ROK family protein, partial [Candidatus Dormibacteraceae bacterium]
LLTDGSMKRNHLAQATGLASPTVFRLVDELTQAGILRQLPLESGQPRRTVGRPAASVELDSQAAVALCMYIGTLNARLALADLRLGILARRLLPLNGADPKASLELAARTLLDMADQAGVDRHRLLGVGIGSSGVVGGGSIKLHSWLGWRDVPARAIVAGATRLPVFVDGAVRSNALSEAWFGHGRDSGTLAVLRVGSVVTSAAVVRRSLVRSGGLVEGQIGHLPAGGDRRCSCGRRGCIEVEARDQSVLADARRLRIATAASRAIDVYDLARSGDRTALSLVDRRGDVIARAVAILEAVFDPGVVVIVGAMAADGGELQMQAIRAALPRHRVLPEVDRPLRLVSSHFDTDSGVAGAGSLVLRQFYEGRLEIARHI